MLKPTCIIVSEQVRHESLIGQLSARFQADWFYIDDKSKFNLQALIEINPDYIFIPHWSYKIPEQIFKRFVCVMFHMTDLPFGRGGSPLQNLIVRGCTETKLTAFRCVEELDAGPVYNKLPLSIQGSAKEIFKEADSLVVELIIDILENQLEPVAQQGEPSFFTRRTPEQGNIEALSELHEVYDYIRMLDADGYPNAFVELPHFKLGFSNAKLENGELCAEVVFKGK